MAAMSLKIGSTLSALTPMWWTWLYSTVLRWAAEGRSPSPADRDASVPEAMNVVMGDEVVVRLADPDGDATGELIAAVGDRAIGDLIEGGLVIWGAANRHFADFDATRPEIGERAAGDPILLAAAGQFESVGPDVPDLTMVERAEANTRPRHGGRHADRRLVKAASRWVRLEVPLPYRRYRRPPAGRQSCGRNTMPCERSRSRGNVICSTNFPATGSPADSVPVRPRYDDLCCVRIDTRRRDQQDSSDLSDRRRTLLARSDSRGRFQSSSVLLIELKHTLLAEVDGVTGLVD